jgi:hypothetical protein
MHALSSPQLLRQGAKRSSPLQIMAFGLVLAKGGGGPPHLGACFVGWEHPFNARPRGIALTFPGSDLGLSCSLVSIRFSAKRRRTVSRETLACSVRLLDHLCAQQL